MKFSALVLALSTASVFALPPAQTVLRKTYVNGLVPPNLRVQITCEINNGQIRWQRSAGSMTVATAQNYVGTPWSVTEAEIVKAEAGKVLEEPAPTDGPTTTYYAERLGKRTTLEATGSYRAKNDALAAKTLVNLLDLNCGAYGQY